MRNSLNEPVYQGFEQKDVDAYFSSLKKLILGPLMTIGLTAGAGAIWSYFSSSPTNMISLLKNFTQMKGSTVSTTPYGTRSKDIHAPSFTSFDEKASIFEDHKK